MTQSFTCSAAQAVSSQGSVRARARVTDDSAEHGGEIVQANSSHEAIRADRLNSLNTVFGTPVD